MGKAMDENLAKNQKFMLEAQRMQVERQMEMQNYMREQMMAAQIARGRDIFHYFAAFYGLTFLGSTANYLKTKNKTAILPLVPLTFIFVYQLDGAYGPKMSRIRNEAARILEAEKDLLYAPAPLPSIEELDRRRLQKDS